MSQATVSFEANQVNHAPAPFEAPFAQSNDRSYDRARLLFWGAYVVFAVALYAATGYLVYRLVGALA